MEYINRMNGISFELRTVKALIKANKLKRVDRRLQAIKLMLEGRTTAEIAEKLDYSRFWVSQLIKEYREKGLLEYARHKYGGNNRSLSQAEEAEILRGFEARAEAGEIVRACEIKKAFDKRIGKDTGRGYIYMLLARHNFRKVAPRPRHPKKASDEAIEASKKLTLNT